MNKICRGILSATLIAIPMLGIPLVTHGQSPTSTDVIRLKPEIESDITEELLEMAEDSGSSSAAVLRPRLTTHAEKIAAGSLAIEPLKLIQYPAVRRQIRTIVRSVLETTALTRSVEKTPTGTTKARKPIAEEREPEQRCECEYCHPLHHSGNCSQRLTRRDFPLLPTVGGYGSPVLYVYPYGQKHRFLHHLLCPCSWCRGW